MIDYFKAEVKGFNLSDLLTNEHLNFIAPYNTKTGEIFENKKIAEYYGLKFELFNNQYLWLKGSLHKYWSVINTGHLTNYDDFSISDLIQVIHDISKKFNLDPNKIYLHGLEFGVNIKVPFIPRKFLKENLINYKGKSKRTEEFNGKGYLVEFERSNYYIKIYDKSLQYLLQWNILRFEIKARKMEFIHKSGIVTLTDLCDISKLKELEKILGSVFDGLLVCDDLYPEIKMGPKDKQIFTQGINPSYWEKLKPDSKDFIKGNSDENYKRQRKRYYRQLNVFNKILAKYKLDTKKTLLSKMIQIKWEELLLDFGKIGDKLTDLLTTKKGQFNPLNILSDCPHKDDCIIEDKKRIQEIFNNLIHEYW